MDTIQDEPSVHKEAEYMRGTSNQEAITDEFYSKEMKDFLCLLDKPTKHDVLIQLAPIYASWRSIGNGLRVSDNDLNSLAQSNTFDQDKLDHVLQRWIDKDSDVTWMIIIDVVRGPLIQNNALAKKIFQYLKQKFSKQQKATNLGTKELTRHEETDFLDINVQQEACKINEPDNITEESIVPDPSSSHNVTMTRSSSSVSDGFVSGVENRKSLLLFDKPAEQDSGISPTTCVSQTPETVCSMYLSAPAEESPNHPETTDNNSCNNNNSSYLAVSMAEPTSHTASTPDGSHRHLSFGTEDKTANHDPETPCGDYLCNVTEESGNSPVHYNTDDNSKENTSSSHETEDSANSNSQVEVNITTITTPSHIVEVPHNVSQSPTQPVDHKPFGNTNERSIEPPFPVEESTQQHQTTPETLCSESNSPSHVPPQKPNSTSQDKSDHPQQDGSDEHQVTSFAVWPCLEKLKGWLKGEFRKDFELKEERYEYDIVQMKGT